ncbi:unnamed protein product [Arctogadus glacialis]
MEDVASPQTPRGRLQHTKIPPPFYPPPFFISSIIFSIIILHHSALFFLQLSPRLLFPSHRPHPDPIIARPLCTNHHPYLCLDSSSSSSSHHLYWRPISYPPSSKPPNQNFTVPPGSDLYIR